MKINKFLKILGITLAVTIIMNIAGIYAYSSGVLSYNLYVPGFNGSITTASRTKTVNGYQFIRNITTNPTYDYLDVLPQVLVNGTYYQAGAWRTLINGTSSLSLEPDGSLGGSSAVMFTGDFRLYIDSKITYISSTNTTGNWYVQ